MRGKAKSVLMSLANEFPTVGRFVCFTRENSSDTRSFYCLTERQIERVAGVVNRMSRKGSLRIHAHIWGWAGCREAGAR